MEIPLAFFYYIYLVLVLVFGIFAFFSLYHLIRFGRVTVQTTIITLVFIGGSAAILILSWWYISQIDWTHTIQLIPTLPV